MSWWRPITPYDGYIGVGLAAVALGSMYIDFNICIKDLFHTSFAEPATQPKTQYITQDTEDSLALDTLTSLLEHYNFSIRETAAKIVCDRAVNDDATLRRLLWGVARPDYEERMASLRALAMLTDQNTLSRLHTREGVAAFVRSLQHCIDGSEDEERRLEHGRRAEKTAAAETEIETGTETDTESECNGHRAIRAAGDSMIADVMYDEYHMRDMAEKLCLMFVAQMAERFGAALLVRAGFVEKWLARQRWVEHPIPQDPAAAAAMRIQCFAQYLKFCDNRIAYLCTKVMELPAGWEALEKTGLVEPKRVRPPKGHKKKRAPLALLQGAGPRSQDGPAGAISETAEAQTQDREHDFAPANPSPLRAELRVVNGTAVSDAAVEGQTGRRPTSQSSREEQRIRRQHREAMVLNDGTRPLRRDDIFERESE